MVALNVLYLWGAVSYITSPSPLFSCIPSVENAIAKKIGPLCVLREELSSP